MKDEVVNNLILCESHVDEDNNKTCDICSSSIPLSYFMEKQSIMAESEFGEEKLQISGFMPKESNTSMEKIDQHEAVSLAKKHMANIEAEDVVDAYDISINSENVEYQPAEYGQSVDVELSNLDLDTSKTYALLHIIDDNNYELLPVNVLNKNTIEFTTNRFSVYILITVASKTVTFDGENFKVFDIKGNEITNGTTIADGTQFNFNIVPNDGYGIKAVTCSNLTIYVAGEGKGKTCSISNVNQDTTIYITSELAPVVTTHPVSAKVESGDVVTFTVAVNNATTYEWQYRESKDSAWVSASTLATNTGTTFSISTQASMSGYEFRCLVGNDSFNVYNAIATDIAVLSITETENIQQQVKLAPATLKINPNGGLYNGSTDITKIEISDSQTIRIGEPIRLNYQFKNWTLRGGGTLNEVDNLGIYGVIDGELALNLFDNLVLVSTGTNPQFILPTAFHSNEIKKVRVTIDNDTASTAAQVYFKLPTTDFTEANSVEAAMSANTSEQVLTFDFSSNTGYTGIVEALRFNIGNTAGNYTIKKIEFLDGNNTVYATHDNFSKKGYTYTKGIETGTVRANWLNINGPRLMAETYKNAYTNGYILGNSEIAQRRYDVLTITIQDTMTVPNGTIIDTWDVSAAGDGSVTAWLVDDATDTEDKCHLYIGGDGEIIASSGYYLFADYTNCTNIYGLDKLDTNNVTDMSYMFYYCSSLMELDVSGFDTSSVTNMSSMFNNCSYLVSLDVKWFDTSSVTNMGYMFYYCSSLQILDVSKFDTSSVRSMYRMFSYCEYIRYLDVSGWNTSNVTDMESMFKECKSLTSLDVSGFDTSSVKDISYMFDTCNSLTKLDVSGFDTSSVTNMSHMFDNCNSLTKLDVSGFDTSNVTDMSYMLSCAGLTSLDVTRFDTSSVTDMSGMFSGCIGLTSLDVTGFDTSSVTDMNYMFSGYSGLTSLDVTGFDTSSVTDMSGMFKSYSSQTRLDLSGFDTSSVQDMSHMFNNYSSPTILDLTGFDTSSVQDMSYMFNNYSSPTILDLTGFDTSSVTNMNYMFSGYSSPTILDLTGFDTSSVTSMSYMFSGYSGLTSLDLTGFDTSSVTDMRGMFEDCSSLTSLDVSGFNTSNVTNMWFMFNDCNSLTSLDVSSWNTSSVQNMEMMFYNCKSLTSLDLSGWNTSSVTDMDYMFDKCRNLNTLLLGENFDKLNGSYMFDSMSKLTAIIVQRSTPLTLSTKITGVPILSKPQMNLYVPNTTAEAAFEAAENYSRVFGADKIRPILEVAGDNPLNVFNDTTYVDPGATVAGFKSDAASAINYTQYGYELTSDVASLDMTTPGTKTITYTLKYKEPNSTDTAETVMTATRTVNVIDVVKVTVPSQSGTLTYTGSAQTPSWSNYDTTYMTIGGTTSGTNAGSYTATFTLKDTEGTRWADGTTAAKTVTWTIGKKAPSAVTLNPTSLTFTYKDAAKTVVLTRDGDGGVSATSSATGVATVSVSGTTLTVTPVAVGTATITVKVAEGTNYTASADKTFTVTVNKLSLTVPSQSGSLTYTGSAQSPSWNNNNSTYMTIGGTTSGTNAGSYNATFTLKDAANTQWADGTTAAKTVTWTIGKKAPSTITLNPTSLTFTYKDAAKTVAVTRDGDGAVSATSSATGVATVSVSGTTITVTPVAAGTSTITVKVAAGTNYTASADKTFTVTVNKLSLTVPSQSGSLTYTGSAQSPSWNNNNSTYMTIGGTTSGTNAGSYTATFTLKDAANTQWADGTTAAKTVTWTIGKKAPSAVTLNPTSLTFTYKDAAKTVAVTRDGDGAVSATSSATGVATVSVSGTTITVTPVAVGTATITVKVAAGTNYTAPADKTFTVTVNKKTVQIKVNDASKMYDGTALTSTAYTVTSGSVASGQTLTITTSGSITNVGSVTNNMSSYKVMNGSTDVTANYTVTATAGTLTITTATPTVTLTNKTAEYTGSAITINTPTVTGATGGTTPNGTLTYTYYTDANCTTTTTSANSGAASNGAAPVNAGTYYVKASMAPAGNYNAATSNVATLTISKKTVQIKVNDASKTYDGTALTSTGYTVTSGSVVSGQTLTITTSGSITNVGSVTNNMSSYKVMNGSTDVTANYTVTATAGTLTITTKLMTNVTATLSGYSFTYTGSAITPTVTVKDGSKTLVSGTDYTVEYENNTNVGSAKVVITGKGNYSGTKEATFAITQANGYVTLSGASGSITYGTATHSFNVATNHGGTLSATTNVSGVTATVSGTTVNVAGLGSLNAGTTVIVTVTSAATQNYKVASATYTLAVEPADPVMFSITLPSNYDYVYSATAKTPVPTVTANGKTLASGTDYTVSYNNNINAGDNTATVIITGKGNYEGSTTSKTFSITKKAITITAGSGNKVYDGTALTNGTASITSGSLVGNHVMTATPQGSITNVGSVANKVATVNITSSGSDVKANYEVTLVDGTLTVTTRKIQIKVNDTSKTYDGTALASTAYTVASGSVVSGQTLTITTSGSITNVGSVTNTMTGYKVMSGSTDVSANYEVTATAGTLTITNKSIANVTIELSESSFTYTGSAIMPTVAVKDGSKTLASGTDYTVEYENNTNAGTAKVVITGKGNYSGTKELTFEITQANGYVTLSEASGSITYGTATHSFGIATNHGGTLSATTNVSGVTATVSGTTVNMSGLASINAGTSVTVTVISAATQNYKAASATYTLNITAAGSVTFGITLPSNYDYVYTGAGKEPVPTITLNGTTLRAGTDYTVSYTNNVNAGEDTAMVIITGIGNYVGSVTNKTFSIEKRTITITAGSGTKVYDGNALTLDSYEITSGSLASGHELEVVLSGNIINVGSTSNTITSVIVTNGNDEVSANYIITKVNGTLTVTRKGITLPTVADKVYNGQEQVALESTTEYTVTGTNKATNVGTYTMTVTPTGNYMWSTDGSAEGKQISWEITEKTIEGATIELSGYSFTYTGNEITPTVAVKDGSKTLVSGTDYTVEYENNTNAGTGKVVITGKGNYSGTKELTFEITQANGYVTLSEASGSTTYGTATHSFSVATNHGGTLSATTNVSGVTATVSGTTVNMSGLASINAGTSVIVTVTSAATQNYKAASATYTLNVTAAGSVTFGITLPSNYDYVYTGAGKEPVPTVTLNGTTLRAGTDYTVSYTNNVNAGEDTAMVIITGIGNYVGSVTNKTFSIEKRTITITAGSATKVYDGNALVSEIANITAGSLVANHIMTATTEGSITNVGSVANKVATYSITSGGTDVKSNYNVTLVDGILTVTRKGITIPTVADKVYNGQEQVALESTTEYTVTGTNKATNVGTYTMTLTPTGNYMWSADGSTEGKQISWEITEKTIEGVTIELSESSFIYTGSAITPTVTVKDGDKVLVNETDYIVEYENNTNAGTAKIIITGIGNYTGSVESKTFSIEKRTITLTAGSATKVYDGNALTLDSYEITSGSLASGHELEVVLSGNITNVGSTSNTITSVIITKNNDDVTANYEITKVNGTLTVTRKGITIPTVADKVYNGQEQVALESTTEYTVTGTNKATNVGTYTTTLTPTGNYMWSTDGSIEGKQISWKITAKGIEGVTIELSESSFTYTGSAITPTVTVKDGDKVLVNETDYTFEYENNTNVGSAKVVITGKGNYSGTRTLTFNITRATGSVTATITGTAVVEQTLTVTGTTASDGAKSYQWWYSTTADATSGTAITGSTTDKLAVKPEMAGKYIGVTVSVAQGTNYTACSDTAITGIVTNAASILMEEKYANAYTNKYILGNSEIAQRREDVLTITLQDTMTVPSGTIIDTWDVSKNKNGSVTAWLVDDAEDTGNKCHLYIGGDGEIIASSGNYLFYGYTNCTNIYGLDKLDTSSVTSMYAMFYNCSSLTSLDVKKFDTSSVTTMYAMFYNCSSLTSLDVKKFDTSNVTNMGHMFYICSSLTSLDVSGFETSNVTAMNGMFSECHRLTSLDVSGFDTGSVTSMNYMFRYSYGLTSLDVSGFDTGSVTSMWDMFRGCSRLTSLDVTKFDTSSVTSMNNMFSECSRLTSLDVSGFDTSNVTDMSGMFSSCSSLTSLDVSCFDTSNMPNVNMMFYFCSNLKTLLLGENFDKLNGSSMFSSTSNLTAIITQRTTPMTLSTNTGIGSNAILYVPSTTAETAYESGENYVAVFGADRIRPILEVVGNNPVSIQAGATYTDAGATVAGFTSSAEDAVNYTQYGYTLTTTGANVDTSKENTTHTVTYTLNYAEPVASGEQPSELKEVMTATRTVNVVDGGPILMTEEYSNAYTNKYILGNSEIAQRRSDVLTITIQETLTAPTGTIIDTWDVSKNKNGKVIAWLVDDATDTGNKCHLYIGGDGEIIASSGYYLFANYTYCKSINGLDKLNTSIVKDMSYMFYSCGDITSLDLSSFDTSNVTNMSYMFEYCYDITSLDLSGFDTSNVTNMRGMFYYCNYLRSLDLSGFDTTNVTNMSFMFYDCERLTTLNINNFDTSNVTDMSYMFDDCRALTSLDLRSFDTSNVTTMSYMFDGCRALTSLDLRSFNTTNVTNMRDMFYQCYNLQVILLGENFDKLNGGADMFYYNSDLTAIITQRSTPMTLDSNVEINSKTILYVQNPTDEVTYEAATNYDTIFGADRIEPILGSAGSNPLTIAAGRGYNDKGATVAGFTSDESSMYTGFGYSITDTKIVQNGVEVEVPDTSAEGLTFDVIYTLSYTDPKNAGSSKVVMTETRNVTVGQVEALLMEESSEQIDNSYADGGYIFGNSKISQRRKDIKKITIKNTISDPAGTISQKWDVSYYQNESVYAWLVWESSISGYHLYIGGEGKVIASNGQYLFYNYYYCTAIDGLEFLDTSRATDMSYMFYNLSNLTTLNLHSLDTSSVIYMSYMFYGCNKLTSLNVSNFDTSNVINMSEMFNNCSSLKSIDISNFDTRNVTNMFKMFSGNKYEVLDLTNFNTEKVTNMTWMFMYSNIKTLLLGENFDRIVGSAFDEGSVSNIITHRSEPMTISSYIGVNVYNTTTLYVPNQEAELAYESAEYYASQFGANRIKTILQINGENPTNVQVGGEYIEKGAKVANLSKENHIKYGYEISEPVITKDGVVVDRIDTSDYSEYEVTYSLYYTDPKAGENATREHLMDITRNVIMKDLVPIIMIETLDNLENGYILGNAEISQRRSDVLSITFQDTLKEPEGNIVAEWDASLHQDFSVKAWLVSDTTDSTMYHLYVGGKDTIISKDCYGLLSDYSNCTSINNLDILDTSDVKNMSFMFNGCSSLTEIDLDGFDTSKVKHMMYMFGGCSSLTSLDLADFDTSSTSGVNLMPLEEIAYSGTDYMFADCTNLRSIVLGEKFDALTGVQMFTGCDNLTSIITHNVEVGKGVPNVGDYVAYVPEEGTYTPTESSTFGNLDQTFTTEDMTWRIMDINNETGKVLITTSGIANIGIEQNTNMTTTSVNQELDAICAALYSNSELGITARSLTLEEQDELLGYELLDSYEKIAYYPVGSSVSGTIEYNGITYTKKALSYDVTRFYSWDGGGAEYTDDYGNKYRVPTVDSPVYVGTVSASSIQGTYRELQKTEEDFSNEVDLIKYIGACNVLGYFELYMNSEEIGEILPLSTVIVIDGEIAGLDGAAISLSVLTLNTLEEKYEFINTLTANGIVQVVQEASGTDCGIHPVISVDISRLKGIGLPINGLAPEYAWQIGEVSEEETSNGGLNIGMFTGVDSLSDIILYVPNETAEAAFESNELCAQFADRIRPILEIVGDNPIEVKAGTKYNDNGVTVAGFEANSKDAKIYTKYGYTLEVDDVDTSTPNTTFDVTYTLKYTDDSVTPATTNTVMTVTRTVNVVTVPSLLMGEDVTYIKEGLIFSNMNIEQRRSDVLSITIINVNESIEVPSGNLIDAWDVSKYGDESVIAALIDDEEDTGNACHLCILSDGKINVSDGLGLFAVYYNCTEINGLENLDTSKVESMMGMFLECSSLTSLDLSGFDTSGLVASDFNMFAALMGADEETDFIMNGNEFMFQGCSNLKSVVLGEKFYDINSFMFEGCDNLTSIITHSTEIGKNRNLKVGDYVNYSPDTGTYTFGEQSVFTEGQTISTEDVAWKVLSIDNETGEVLLTPDGAVNVGITQDTESNFYINPKEELDSVCEELYSNDSLDAKARSLTLEELNTMLGYEVLEDMKYSVAVYPAGTEVSGTIQHNGKTYIKVALNTDFIFYVYDDGGVENIDSYGNKYVVPEEDNPVFITVSYVSIMLLQGEGILQIPVMDEILSDMTPISFKYASASNALGHLRILLDGLTEENVKGEFLPTSSVYPVQEGSLGVSASMLAVSLNVIETHIEVRNSIFAAAMLDDDLLCMGTVESNDSASIVEAGIVGLRPVVSVDISKINVLDNSADGNTEETAYSIGSGSTGYKSGLIMGALSDWDSLPNDVVLYVQNEDIEAKFESNEMFAGYLGEDRIQPILELVGEESREFADGSEYVDEGATVGGFTEDESGEYTQYGYELVTKIETADGTVVSSVDPFVPNTYNITYTLYYKNPSSDESIESEEVMTVQRTITISNVTLNDANTKVTVSIPDEVREYKAAQYTPEVTVKYNDTVLNLNSDYIVTYGENINVGTGTITITGRGTGYSGSRTVTFVIAERNITVKAGSASKQYDGTELTCSEYEITSGSIAAGDVLSVTTKGSITLVGTTSNIIETIKIFNSEGEVTSNYNIEVEDGILEILAGTIKDNVIIKGENRVGQTLTTALTVNESEYTCSYQWYSNDTNSMTGGTQITGATSESLVITEDMLNKYIYVEVTVSIPNHEDTTLKDITNTTDNRFAKVFNGYASILKAEAENVYTTDYIFGNSSISQRRSDISRIIVQNNMTAPTDATVSFDVSKEQNKSVMAWLVPNNSMYDLYIGGNSGVIASSGSYLFANYTNCTSITGLEYLNTYEVTDMKYMFADNSSLTNLAIEDIQVNFALDMSYMFKDCSKLTSLDLSNFETDSATSMKGMFSGCSVLTSLDVSKLITVNVTDMSGMFENCSGLEIIDVSSFYTNKVTNMASMFAGCSKVSKLELLTFNTSKVKSVGKMFKGCTALVNLDLSRFDLRALDGSTYYKEVDGVKDIGQVEMFNGCTNLYTMVVGKYFARFDGANMFTGCNKLVSIIAQSSSAMPLGTATGLNALTNAVLYVPKASAEVSYENASNYSSVFGADRVKPMIEVLGNNPEYVKLNGKYEDAGVRIAGFDKTQEAEYNKYGYSLVVENADVNTSQLGTTKVIYKLNYFDTMIDIFEQ